MEFILNRYRNLTVLLIVVTAQLLLIAYQVRTAKDVPLVRVWAVTAVTPVERMLEWGRRNTWGFVEDYFFLLNTRHEQLQKELGRLKLENQYLKTELSTADRAKALGQFQAQSPSKMIAARIIGNGTGANSKAVFVDRGSGSGIENGMAVVTPDGIVGKVIAAYPTASLVLLITDANFAAGVISQKNRVHGTLKGQGHDGTVLVDYVQSEEKVDPGEWFYTSGDDRIFPKGFPVGQVTTIRNGHNFKEVYVTPSGFQNGLEEVLIVLEGVHQAIPEWEMASPGINLIPAPPTEGTDAASPQTPPVANTDADRLKEQYRQPGTPNNAQTPPASGQQASQPGAATAAAVPVKPKPKAPLLVTDPTDADPDEPAVAVAPPRRADADTGSKKKSTGDANTEILPPAPAPKPKPNVR
jgi:rod shape-determining protein MreC